MSDPKHQDESPTNYAVGPKESIFALGVISLNYGMLEFVFQRLFGIATKMPGSVPCHIFKDAE